MGLLKKIGDLVRRTKLDRCFGSSSRQIAMIGQGSHDPPGHRFPGCDDHRHANIVGENGPEFWSYDSISRQREEHDPAEDRRPGRCLQSLTPSSGR
jgi:hypothetical protein